MYYNYDERISNKKQIGKYSFGVLKISLKYFFLHNKFTRMIFENVLKF